MEDFIGTFSALAVIIITKLFDWLEYKSECKQKIKEANKEKQREYYVDYVDSFQKFVDEQSKGKYIFASKVNKILLFGEAGTAELIGKYFNDIVSGRYISVEEHNKRNNEIMKSMRKDFDLSVDGLDGINAG